MEQLKMIHKLESFPEYPLAEGFTERNYQPGDEVVWTEICKHGILLEHEGIECWDLYMIAMNNLVPERDVFFICDSQGKAVATYTAFVPEEDVGLMHMLGAKPEARGHKLGQYMTYRTLSKLKNEARMVLLRTDDWRESAIRAYLLGGFQPVLYDMDMDKRWKKICDKLDIHGVQMLDVNGEPTGIVL